MSPLAVVRRKRILIASGFALGSLLGIAIILAGVYALFFGNIMVRFDMGKIARKSPIVRQTPHPLPDLSVSQAPGTKLTYYGYEFEVPWDDLDPSKTRLRTYRAIIYSRRGNGLMFTKLPPRELVNGLLANGTLLDKDSFVKTYGDAPLQSDYAINSLILNATPDQVTLFTSGKEAEGTSVLVLIKAVIAQSEAGLFSIQNKDFRGFQWGDPRHMPLHVVATLYADDGGVEFVFLGPKDPAAPPLSQAGINRVLQTVRKVADQPKSVKTRSGL